jgi:hypothetical protein
MRFHQFSENSAMDDTVEIMKKSFSPERKAVQAEVLELVRAVQMGKGDKIELAMKLTALAKRELEAKRNDPDLKISVDQNLGMLDRAMKVVTGMSEGITEEELEEYKNIASLRNRSSFDAMARLQDRNKKKEPKVIEIPKGTQLDLFKKAAGESVEESLTEEQFDEKAGEKDACYRKVKSRYKVWPSAYASGALVKCRKVGAANWGNSKKK